MLGARYLAMGNIIDISSRTTEFRGYGITTRRSFVSLTLNLRVVDAERGTVVFTDQVTLSRENLPFEFTVSRFQEMHVKLWGILCRKLSAVWWGDLTRE